MENVQIAAYIHTILIAVVIAFQGALALGAPWGELAMGGKFPGKFPPKLRVVAFFQMGVLASWGLVVLIRAHLVLAEYFSISETLIWFVVGISALGTVLNIITPSKKERMLWGPVSFFILLSATAVAVS